MFQNKDMRYGSVRKLKLFRKCMYDIIVWSILENVGPFCRIIAKSVLIFFLIYKTNFNITMFICNISVT